jgi:hypothetical protein
LNDAASLPLRPILEALSMTILEREGFQQWKDSPLTREFLGLLSKRQSGLMEAWGRGQP